MSLERRLGSFKYFLTLVALTLLSSAAYVALGKYTQKPVLRIWIRDPVLF